MCIIIQLLESYNLVTFVVHFGYTSLKDDLRPGFTGHMVVNFKWNRPYNGRLNVTTCILPQLFFSLSLAKNTIENLELIVSPIPPNNYDADVCGIVAPLTELLPLVNKQLLIIIVLDDIIIITQCIFRTLQVMS